MYHYECDWCHERIDVHRKPYVKVSIDVIGTTTDYRGKREAQVEPARFFHAAPLRSRDEWDRLGLGLEVKDETLSDCCYTRALRAIEGDDFSAPDAGFEWQLVPVGSKVEGDVVRVPDQGEDFGIDNEPLWTYKTVSGRPMVWLRDEDALQRLGRVMVYANRPCPVTYSEAGIRTVGDLRAAVAGDSLTDVEGVGPKTARAVTGALERFLAESEQAPTAAAKGRVKA